MKSAILALTAGLMFSTAVAAQTPIQAADIYNVRLGRAVTLEGRIVEHIREDYYRFEDESGAARIELEWSVRRNRDFGPETKVRISGDVDRSLLYRYISVERLTILD